MQTSQETVLARKVIVSAGTGSGLVSEALHTHLSVLPQVLTWFPRRAGSAFRRSGNAGVHPPVG